MRMERRTLTAQQRATMFFLQRTVGIHEGIYAPVEQPRVVLLQGVHPFEHDAYRGKFIAMRATHQQEAGLRLALAEWWILLDQ